jgi:UDP-N-acetylglucosamine 2-epimerase (non-hydrolysing)
MQKLLVTLGTRPEAIKLCPLALHLRERGDFEVKVCATGQHRSMLDQVLTVFGVTPDYDLNIMNRRRRSRRWRRECFRRLSRFSRGSGRT